MPRCCSDTETKAENDQQKWSVKRHQITAPAAAHAPLVSAPQRRGNGSVTGTWRAGLGCTRTPERQHDKYGSNGCDDDCCAPCCALRRTCKWRTVAPSAHRDDAAHTMSRADSQSARTGIGAIRLLRISSNRTLYHACLACARC
eukprot:1206696-Pleurochrysis_carterae.AAC.4